MNRETIYTYTATGDLGSQRETMLQNELHLRDKIGRPKTRGHNIGDYFCIADPNERRENNAAEALRGWPRMTTVVIEEEEKKKERDFVGLNKAAIQSGLVTAQEHYDYRTMHDMWRTPDGVNKPKGKSLTRRFPASMTFGMSVRPSTPIFDLLEHKYQTDWIKEHRRQELQKKKEDRKRHQLHVNHTRTSQLRTFVNPVDPTPLWQMPRFTRNARPHLQTFRSVTLNEDALGKYKYDRISRRGITGQGIYQPSAS